MHVPPVAPDELDLTRLLAELARNGSRDPDVLLAWRRDRTARARALRRGGAGLAAFGGLLSLTGIGAIAGIPALVDGVRRVRAAGRGLRAIDAAFLAWMRGASTHDDLTAHARTLAGIVPAWGRHDGRHGIAGSRGGRSCSVSS